MIGGSAFPGGFYDGTYSVAFLISSIKLVFSGFLPLHQSVLVIICQTNTIQTLCFPTSGACDIYCFITYLLLYVICE